jgi:hypothetical protein
MATNMLVKVAGVVSVAPIFLVPSAALAGLGGYIGNIYMTAELPVKREQSNAKAPVLGHFSAAIAGLSMLCYVYACLHVLTVCATASVRAYGAQDAFRLESHKRIDRFTIAARTAFNLNRSVSRYYLPTSYVLIPRCSWVAIRIDVLGGMFASGLGAYLVYSPQNQTSASNTGFALTMAGKSTSFPSTWIVL